MLELTSYESGRAQGGEEKRHDDDSILPAPDSHEHTSRVQPRGDESQGGDPSDDATDDDVRLVRGIVLAVICERRYCRGRYVGHVGVEAAWVAARIAMQGRQ